MAAKYAHDLTGADIPDAHHPVSPLAADHQAFPVPADGQAASPPRPQEDRPAHGPVENEDRVRVAALAVILAAQPWKCVRGRRSQVERNWRA